MRRLGLGLLLAPIALPAIAEPIDPLSLQALKVETAVVAPLRLRLDGSQLVASLSQPGSKLVLERAGKAQATVDAPGAETRFPVGHGDYVVRLLDDKGKELARQAIKVETGAQLQLHVTNNQVFGSKTLPLAVTASPGELSLLLDGKVVHTQSVKQAGTLVLPAVAITPGRHQLQLSLDLGGKTLSSPALQVFSFGIEPLDANWLLADKYNFTLYWIREGVLHRIYPVATGRPGLPTQPGFWLIGNKDVMFPASDWGSYRLRIYRENQYKHHWSGYAVHGTNKPGSIGTEASHGCLRMFNKDVTELYQGIRVGMPLLIEEKLPVFIESVTPQVASN